jgi:hypothetical protein
MAILAIIALCGAAIVVTAGVVGSDDVSDSESHGIGHTG